jgi:hypothetical protein
VKKSEKKSETKTQRPAVPAPPTVPNAAMIQQIARAVAPLVAQALSARQSPVRAPAPQMPARPPMPGAMRPGMGQPGVSPQVQQLLQRALMQRAMQQRGQQPGR